MKKIVIIGANSFQNPLILKAKELGYETHVFAWEDGSIGEKTADYFYPISIIEKEQILDKCKEIKPDAITTIASDLATITVNYVARNLGLPCNSERCTSISTDKYEMRSAFHAAGVPVPQYFKVESSYSRDDIIKMKLPVIVKPTDRSGSRGITKLTDWNALDTAIQDAVDNSFNKAAIVEEYLEGPEYSCECISYHGVHYFLTITKKYTTGSPHFIETGHLEPSDLTENMIERVKTSIFNALDALEVTDGASHAEFKVSSTGEIGIIEIGARMGGDCIGSDLVQISTGYDFLKMVIDVALGHEPRLERVSVPRIARIVFIFQKKDLELLEKIKEYSPDALYYVSDMSGEDQHEIVDSSSRYGYYILSCKDMEELECLMNL